MKTRAEAFETLEEPQKRGQATEAILTAMFVLRDIPVLTPRYDNHPYDLVIDLDGEFYRIQIKTAYGGPDTVQFETVSTRRKSSGYERSAYDGLIDLFAVYYPARDYVFLVFPEEAAAGKMAIRLTEPKNNQSLGVNWFEEFLLDKRLSELRNG